jgi:NADH dehydrogenase FAD-containing subunit
MRSIGVVGGGIAGIEAALTLARTLDDATVTLLADQPTLRLLPNLVYVPFGVDAREVLVPLSKLLEGTGVELRTDGCHGIDVERRALLEVDGWRRHDAIVVAPGVDAEHTDGHSIRTLVEAMRLREQLATLGAGDTHAVVAVRVLPGCTWMGPAVELTLLLSGWLRSTGLSRSVALLLATEEHEPLNAFGYVASDLLAGRLADAGIELLTGLPPGRVETVDADLCIDFAGMFARDVAGMPAPGFDGFHAVGDDCQLAPGVFVVGDAASMPFKAGFATAWQARQVAAALGGDLARLGSSVDGVPVDCCEYQLDLGGDATLHARFAARQHLAGSHIGGHVSVWVSPDPPRKLAGSLLRDRLDAVGPARGRAQIRSEVRQTTVVRDVAVGDDQVAR